MRISSIAKWLLAISIIFSACEQDKTPVNPGQVSVSNIIKGAFIVNEGNFTQSNASLDFYMADSGKMLNSVFQAQNNAALGDVAQSMTIVDSLGFVVVNNSDKIEVINVTNFKRIAVIRMPAGASPRYLVIAGSKGFVTALFKNLVYVVDMNSFTIIDSVAVGANPEEIIVHQNKIYVANSGFGNGNTVTVISATNLNPVKTITVGDNPQFLRVDGIGNIHVLCGGAYNDFNDPNDDTPGGIWLVDPSTDTVVDSLVLPAGTHPSDLAIGSGEVGYFINGSAIASYNTMTLALMNSTLINGFFYAMNINTKTNELFVTDAKDFVSPGELIIFDTNGVEKARYTTGVIPGHVTFLGY
jgi:hypothetical protein